MKRVPEISSLERQRNQLEEVYSLGRLVGSSALEALTTTPNRTLVQEMEATLERRAPSSSTTLDKQDVRAALARISGYEACNQPYVDDLVQAVNYTPGSTVSAATFARVLLNVFSPMLVAEVGIDSALEVAKIHYATTDLGQKIMRALPENFAAEVGKEFALSLGVNTLTDIKRYFSLAGKVQKIVALSCGVSNVGYQIEKSLHRATANRQSTKQGPVFTSVVMGRDGPGIQGYKSIALHRTNGSLSIDGIKLITPLGMLQIWRGRVSDTSWAKIVQSLDLEPWNPVTKIPLQDSTDTFYVIGQNSVFRKDVAPAKEIPIHERIPEIAAIAIWPLARLPHFDRYRR